MSKYEKYQTVWVKGTIVGGTQDDPQVQIRGYCYVDTRSHEGGMDIATVVTPGQLKPDVTFPWSPAKKAKKKAETKRPYNHANSHINYPRNEAKKQRSKK